MTAQTLSTETVRAQSLHAKPKASKVLSQADLKLREKKLKKHVAAIHTDGQLSLLQRKLSNVLLLNAYDQLLTKPEHEIDEKTLCVMLGYDSNDRAPLKSALKALAAVQTEWDILDDDGGEIEWGVASLLSHAVLSKGRCRYGYAPTLAEKLYNPAIDASINMKVPRRFRSGNALALYENCYRFKNTGSTGWWDIQLFRRLLGIGDSDYYKSFKHLNAKIIKPVVKEINKSSDIKITPEFKKQGRSISEIRFVIEPNEQLPLMDIDDDDAVKGTSAYQRLITLGIAHKLAQQWIVTHGESYVTEKLDYAGQQRKQGKIRGSVSGFVNAAINKDYKTEVAAEKKAKQVSSAKEIAQLNAEKAQSAKIKREKKELTEKAGRAVSWLEAQDLSQKHSIMESFKKTLDKDYLVADLAKHGLASPLIAGRFADYIFDNHSAQN